MKRITYNRDAFYVVYFTSSWNGLLLKKNALDHQSVKTFEDNEDGMVWLVRGNCD